uniref:Putative regulator of chromosome condensation n=1 Tax=Trypanosoma congolense (strain IL3000) TaxID=1068625 RepID=G0UPH2_TRYCI|nr:putative regulator of chromosome condensation [Trypanosoma congolense IL3000]
MQPLVELFLRGDQGALSQILALIETHGGVSIGEDRELMFHKLVDVLITEGRRSKENVHGSAANKEKCYIIMKIFNAILSQSGSESVLLRQILVETGVSGFRTMNLDYYFSGQSLMNTHIARFVATAARLLRVRVSEILTMQSHIALAESQEDPREHYQGQSTASVHDTESSGSFPSRATVNHLRYSMARDVTGAQQGRGMRGADGSRSDAHNNLYGATRQWRELPAVPSFVPFDKNPLHDDKLPSTHGGWMPPQFPAPIMLFARQFGEGCEAKLPVRNNVTLKDVEEHQQAQDTSEEPDLARSEEDDPLQAIEKQCHPLFNRYLSKGVVFTWGNVASVKTGKKLQLSSPSNSWDPPQGSYTLIPTRMAIPVPVLSFSCGAYSCYFLTADNKVFSCGNDDWSQLGAGKSKELRSSSVVRHGEGKYRLFRVPLRSGDHICKLTAGSAFAAAIGLQSRRMYLWGQNSFGQCLMEGSLTVSTPVAVDIPGQYSEVVDVACGSFYAAIAFSCGSVGTWGVSTMLATKVAKDQLRDADAPNNQKCAKTINLFKPFNKKVVALRAGPFHCLAITSSGAVYSWGMERNGRLGHGDNKNEERMRVIDALSSHVIVDASCGCFHTAVLTKHGQVYVFGENSFGQLGLKGQQPRLLPEVVPLPKRAIVVSCGREHTCILLEDGDLMACGSVRSSGVGVGFGARFSVPRRILQNFLIMSVASGDLHAIASGTLRTMTLTAVQTPQGSPVDDNMSKLNEMVKRHGLRSLCVGKDFAVILAETGEAFAIGCGSNGQLGSGDDTPAQRNLFRRVVVPDFEDVCAVDCGFSFAIAIGSSGALYSWGWNTHGQLGHGLAVELGESVFTPKEISVVKTLSQVIQVACGGTFVVALTQCGEVYTWGEAAFCGHGNGVEKFFLCPKRLASLQDISAVAAGDRHAAALSYDHTIYAWGNGPVGNGGAAGVMVPTPVALNFVHPVRQLFCGQVNTFVITDVGDLYVWGLNTSGQCGALQGAINSSQLAPGRKTINEDAGRRADFPHVLFPTFVASDVRDAAFTGKCGVYVKEDGTSHVCGCVQQEKREVFVRTFTQQILKVSHNEQSDRIPPSTDPHVVRCFHGYDSVFLLVERERPPTSSLRSARQHVAAIVRGTRATDISNRSSLVKEK